MSSVKAAAALPIVAARSPMHLERGHHLGPGERGWWPDCYGKIVTRGRLWPMQARIAAGSTPTDRYAAIWG